MGWRVQATCLTCGHEFEVDHGGGSFFHLVRCDTCGQTKSIGFDKIRNLQIRYLKGLPESNWISSSDHDRYMREHAEVDPISEEEYYNGINAFAGFCECGGKFSLMAPARCPNCHSTQIKEGGVIVMYD